MKRYIAEFIGTYGLVFCGTGAVVVNDITNGTITHLGVATVFGVVVCVLVYAFGKISGTHINPAVTIAFSWSKLFEVKEIVPYIIAQLLGAIAASISLKIMFPIHENLGSTLPIGSWYQSFILEVIMTYFLMVIILFVSQNKEVTHFTGIAVGGIVLVEALFAGPISGASMNPARSIGPALVSGNLNHLWIYIVAPILGAILGSITWNYLKEEK